MAQLINAPKPGTGFYRFNNRLALYHPAVDHQDYWQEYWTDYTKAETRRAFETGFLGEMEYPLLKYLQPGERILEAGCGAGQYVAGLHQHGFSVTGIDYEPQVISYLRSNYPALQTEEQNILQLPYPDHSWDAYLSFGVVEHFPEGPEAALKEAARIIKPGGMGLISVPFLNLDRARQLGQYRADNPLPEGKSFHQYYFAEKEFRKILLDCGWETVETYGYSVEAFLTREHRMVSRFWKSPLARTRLKSYLKQYFAGSGKAYRSKYAHMMLYCCKRQTTT